MIGFEITSTPKTNAEIIRIINRFTSLGWMLLQTKSAPYDQQNISHLLVWPKSDSEPKWPKSIQRFQTQDLDCSDLLAFVKSFQRNNQIHNRGKRLPADEPVSTAGRFGLMLAAVVLDLQEQLFLLAHTQWLFSWVRPRFLYRILYQVL